MVPHGNITYPTVLVFGDKQDRVIETVGMTHDGHAFELGYYNGDVKPKAIINISPAVGCPVGCNFCELTDSGRILTIDEMTSQVHAMAAMAKDYDGLDLTHQLLKINIAKTGEPVLNRAIPDAMSKIRNEFQNVSFKYSTSMPDVKFLEERIRAVADFAAHHKGGTTQLQISLISTNEDYRKKSAGARLASLPRISRVIDAWHDANPQGRTPNGSLLVGAQTPCDPREILDILPPHLIKLRIRKIVATDHSKSSGITDVSEARIQDIIHIFRDHGYDISDAGIPTPTESKHGLASNVTRHRMLQGSMRSGVIFIP